MSTRKYESGNSKLQKKKKSRGFNYITKGAMDKFKKNGKIEKLKMLKVN